MNGWVSYWSEERNLGSVRTDDRVGYLVLRRDIEPDSIGRRFLVLHELVTFDISEERLDRAERVKPCFREPVEEMPEIVTLKKWNGVYGWAAREIGGDLFIHRNEIVTQGIETLMEGSRIRCLPAPPARSGDPNWVGTEIEIFLPEEIEPDSQGDESE